MIIHNVSGPVMKEGLRYIYLGIVESVEELGAELCALAIKVSPIICLLYWCGILPVI